MECVYRRKNCVFCNKTGVALFFFKKLLPKIFTEFSIDYAKQVFYSPK